MLHNKFLEKAVYIRELENFLLELFSRGLLNGTVHTCVGQELIPVIISKFLDNGDRIFSNHRGHGHYIADGNSAEKLILELMGDSDGISSGIGGSQHIYTESFISNGIQGGLAPVSVGYSFVNKLNRNNNISVCYVGDGTLGEGQLYEALTLAGVFESPALFVLENNGYAQSTSSKYTLKGNTKKRIEGFNLKYFRADIWDLDNLIKISEKAIDFVKKGYPALLEIQCYRLNSHSKGDDNRRESEIEEYQKRDLVNQFIESNPEWYKSFKTDLLTKFNDIVNNSSSKSIESSILKNNSVIRKNFNKEIYQIHDSQRGKRLNELINVALDEILEKHNAIMIGEDIEDSQPETPIQYGGAFKVTKGLSSKFPDLVKNTSISEAGITGFGIGCALNKNFCIVEIMFGDFMTLCVDQIIQQASKIPMMYGVNIELPLIIRTPMGGRRGYGPTHSQNLEKLFLFWPNIDVIAINHLNEVKETYHEAINNNKTTIVIEDKVSYTQKAIDEIPIGYNINQSNEAFKTYFLDPDFVEPNVTIILYGAMLNELISVLPELIDEEIFPSIICPTKLSPLNIDIFENVNFIDYPCIFIEEGSKRTSWSSEVISSLLEQGNSFKKIHRISNEYIIPCSKALEEKIFPSRINLVKSIRRILA